MSKRKPHFFSSRLPSLECLLNRDTLVVQDNVFMIFSYPNISLQGTISREPQQTYLERRFCTSLNFRGFYVPRQNTVIEVRKVWGDVTALDGVRGTTMGE